MSTYSFHWKMKRTPLKNHWTFHDLPMEGLDCVQKRGFPWSQTNQLFIDPMILRATMFWFSRGRTMNLAAQWPANNQRIRARTSGVRRNLPVKKRPYHMNQRVHRELGRKWLVDSCSFVSLKNRSSSFTMMKSINILYFPAMYKIKIKYNYE